MLTEYLENKCLQDFTGGPVVKIPPVNAKDMGSIPGPGTKDPMAAGHLASDKLPQACMLWSRASQDKPLH